MKSHEVLAHIPEAARRYQTLGKKPVEHYLKLLETHCSRSLAASRATGALLYRGMRGGKPWAFVAQSRSDRRAKDTPQSTQELMDRFLGAAGFKALRGNSIFVTSDAGEAQGYGSLYVIFPWDTAAVTWNRRIKDFYDRFENEHVGKWLTRALGDQPQYLAIEREIRQYARFMDRLGGDIEGLSWNTRSSKLAKSLRSLGNQLEDHSNELEFGWLDQYSARLHPGIIDPVTLDSLRRLVQDPQFQSQLDTIGQKIWPGIQNKITTLLDRTRTNDPARLLQVYMQGPKYTAQSARVAAHKLGFVDGDLAQALRSRKEIYVSGRYYAFDSRNRITRDLIETVT